MLTTWHGMATPQQHRPKGTQHVQAMSKEDKMKLEPSVATGYVDGSTPMAWHGTGHHSVEERVHQATDQLLIQLFGDALDKRLATNSSDAGMINLWQHRVVLRKLNHGLAPFKNSNLLNAFDQLFRSLGVEKTSTVRFDDLLFCVQSAVVKMNELTKA